MIRRFLEWLKQWFRRKPPLSPPPSAPARPTPEEIKEMRARLQGLGYLD